MLGLVGEALDRAAEAFERAPVVVRERLTARPGVPTERGSRGGVEYARFGFFEWHVLVHLAPLPESVHLARQAATTALSGLGRDDLVDDAAVVVTELVANAVMHARTQITVSVDAWGVGIRLRVADASDKLPRWTPVRNGAHRGRVPVLAALPIADAVALEVLGDAREGGAATVADDPEQPQHRLSDEDRGERPGVVAAVAHHQVLERPPVRPEGAVSGSAACRVQVSSASVRGRYATGAGPGTARPANTGTSWPGAWRSSSLARRDFPTPAGPISASAHPPPRGSRSTAATTTACSCVRPQSAGDRMTEPVTAFVAMRPVERAHGNVGGDDMFRSGL